MPMVNGKKYPYTKEGKMEAKKAAELVEAGLALLDGTYTGPKKNCKKNALAKAKEALAKAKRPSQKPRKLKKQPR